MVLQSKRNSPGWLNSPVATHIGVALSRTMRGIRNLLPKRRPLTDRIRMRFKSQLCLLIDVLTSVKLFHSEPGFFICKVRVKFFHNLPAKNRGEPPLYTQGDVFLGMHRPASSLLLSGQHRSHVVGADRLSAVWHRTSKALCCSLSFSILLWSESTRGQEQISSMPRKAYMK